jgi:hypothetical protein
LQVLNVTCGLIGPASHGDAALVIFGRARVRYSTGCSPPAGDDDVEEEGHNHHDNRGDVRGSAVLVPLRSGVHPRSSATRIVVPMKSRTL